MKIRIFLAAVAGLGLSALASAGTIVLSDSTFNLSNYTITTFASGSSSIVVSQSADFGSPSPSLLASVSFPPLFSQPLPEATAYLVSNLMHYDPSRSGAVLAIDYQVDLTSKFSNPILVGQAFAIPVIEQNGEFYARKDGAFTNPDQFTTIARPNLAPFGWGHVTDKTFVSFDNTGPDYSKPMSFGLAATATEIGPSSESLGYQVWFDNLKFTLHTAAPVPEPSSSALLLGGLGKVCTTRAQGVVEVV